MIKAWCGRKNVAPFDVYLARLGNNSEETKAADELYEKLTNAGVAVIYDDRDVRAGEMFADADLMGIPYRLVVSAKTVASGEYELKERTEDSPEFLPEEAIIKKVCKPL